MLNIIIARDGTNVGVSLVGEQIGSYKTFSPYNTFVDINKDQQKILIDTINWAKKTSDRNYTWANHTVLLAAMLLEHSTISYPEAGALPAVQTAFITYVVKLLLDNPEREITIYTVSEYMVRMLQVLVQKKIIKTEDIAIFDQDNCFDVNVYNDSHLHHSFGIMTA